MAKSQQESDLDNPDEAFAWMFAAGVPDPRGDKYPHQPQIPVQCWPVLSRMIWEMGGRVDPSKQVKWVNPRSGPMMSFQAWGATTEEPEQVPTQSESEQIAKALQAAVPQTAQMVAQAQTAEDAEKVGEELQKKIADGFKRIEQLSAQLNTRG